MKDIIMVQEKKHLKDTKHDMKELLLEEEQKLIRLPRSYGHDPRLLSNLMSISATKVQNLTKGIDKPYFARIDFKEYEKKTEDNLYIGKVGVIGNDSEIIVTDWRTPVASLYYDGHLGKVSYLAPIGTVEGDLNLKRQIIIEEGELVEFFDVDSVSDDELLKPYLGASADNRLKNIVASIQSEQNDIIRKELYKNTIVQGVAGSGKTTVALHRIAYLVYNYKDKANPDQFLVIGPNKFFINYISSVLPDLDVGNAQQFTYEELAQRYIDEKFEIKDSTEKLIELVNGKAPNSYLRYKTSMRYKEAIDKFRRDIEEILLPKEGFILNGFEVFTREDIIREYNEATISKSIEAKFNKVILQLSSRLQRSEQIENRCKKYFDDLLKGIEVGDSRFSDICNKHSKTREILEKGAAKELKTYLSVKNTKVLALYKAFIENIDKYVDNSQVKIDTEALKIDTLLNISKKNVDFEDVPALMYIKYLVFGEKEYSSFVHTVVDESQDFGAFNFYVLKEILSKSTFSIFGDITQGIYSYRGIYNWEEVKREVFEDKIDLMYLEKSYRTTIEIMEAANNVSRHLKLGEGKPVIRHGEKVNVKKIAQDEKGQYIADRIKELKNKGYKSIAVICKTPAQSQNVYIEIKDKVKDISNISGDEVIYNGGVCVLTSYLAKGLEFDAVIIYDASEKTYSSKNETEMKLVYVAMTRALHKLDILYEGELTQPLKDV